MIVIDFVALGKMPTHIDWAGEQLASLSPFTVDTSRVEESQAPVKEFGSGTQTVHWSEPHYLLAGRCSTSPCEVTFHVPRTSFCPEGGRDSLTAVCSLKQLLLQVAGPREDVPTLSFWATVSSAEPCGQRPVHEPCSRPGSRVGPQLHHTIWHHDPCLRFLHRKLWIALCMACHIGPVCLGRPH